eukprot:4509816-Lingulodinium_polyedra.AAC.1
MALMRISEGHVRAKPRPIQQLLTTVNTVFNMRCAPTSQNLHSLEFARFCNSALASFNFTARAGE